MNIEQARMIPLAIILPLMQANLDKENNKDAWYYSPLRQEKSASLHVDKAKNIWYDFGEAMGGDNIELVRLYLKRTYENSTVKDALRWLENMTAFPVHFNLPLPEKGLEQKEINLVLVSKKKLNDSYLTAYIKSRGIGIAHANLYVKELRILNRLSGKRFNAIGFQNEDEGYELRNAYFKGCIAPKTITFIRGVTPKPSSINVFEGMFDFLSISCRQPNGKLQGDTIILNSVACMDKAFPFIQKYGYDKLFTWMDNDIAGESATTAWKEFAETEKGLKHIPMNHLYKKHKDVNAWHMHTLGLKVQP